MAPVLASIVNMTFPDKLSSSRHIDECEEIEKVKIKRQNSASFPEQQDTKDISSMEEWRRSLTLFPAGAYLGHPQLSNSVVPVEHPLSPDAKRGMKVDQWPGQTLALEKMSAKTISHQKKAVEHELNATLQTKENGDEYDGQKAIEKNQLIDVTTNYPKGLFIFIIM